MTLKQARLPMWRLERFVCAGGTDRAIAEAAHINHRSVRVYREGGVPFLQADRIACRLGVHPGCIWPEYWTTAVEALDD